MIPKIIWQTYEIKYDDLHQKAKEFSESWKSLNNSWEYRYFSDKDRREFVKEYFDKEWYTIYSSYKIDVMRADLWRYMCLYIYGGLYCDLDLVCKEPIENWLDLNSKFVVSEEPGIPGYTQMIFASEPNNIFLKDILESIKNKYYSKSNYNDLKSYIAEEVGYKIFSKSIENTLIKTKEGFVEFIGKDAEIIHYDVTDHYHASETNIFGKNYKKWKKDLLNEIF
jgi:mannosyltransferase OCH1-like enzyme